MSSLPNRLYQSRQYVYWHTALHLFFLVSTSKHKSANILKNVCWAIKYKSWNNLNGNQSLISHLSNNIHLNCIIHINTRPSYLCLWTYWWLIWLWGYTLHRYSILLISADILQEKNKTNDFQSMVYITFMTLAPLDFMTLAPTLCPVSPKYRC